MVLDAIPTPMSARTSGGSIVLIPVDLGALVANAAITWPQGDVEGALDVRGGGSGEWRYYTVWLLPPNASSFLSSFFVEMDTLVR